MSSGTTKIRNKRFIKHLSKEDTRGERHVHFQLSDNNEPQNNNNNSDPVNLRGADTDRENLSGPLTRGRARNLGF